MKQHHFTVITTDGRYVSLLASSPAKAIKKAEEGKGVLVDEVVTRIRKARVQRGYMTYGDLRDVSTDRER